MRRHRCCAASHVWGALLKKKIQPSAAAAPTCALSWVQPLQSILCITALHHKEGILKNAFIMAFLSGQLGRFRGRAGMRDLELSGGLSEFVSVVSQPGFPTELNKMEIKDCQSCK